MSMELFFFFLLNVHKELVCKCSGKLIINHEKYVAKCPEGSEHQGYILLKKCHLEVYITISLTERDCMVYTTST